MEAVLDGLSIPGLVLGDNRRFFTSFPTYLERVYRVKIFILSSLFLFFKHSILRLVKFLKNSEICHKKVDRYDQILPSPSSPSPHGSWASKYRSGLDSSRGVTGHGGAAQACFAADPDAPHEP